MKAAICYLSCHHGNTRKLVETMAAEGNVDLIDVRTRQTVCLNEYDCIGLASGIYGFCPTVSACGQTSIFGIHLRLSEGHGNPDIAANCRGKGLSRAG